ncbi:four-carbon acid sugar kinase family protein [Acidiphilium sp.]|uniref:four-carbon acid sugar kinase family protein n=1 Tax=Acidiphilium sp. TaxID=527 RepID=UPI0033901467
MRDSNLVRVLARQSSRPVGLVPFEVVERGAAAISAALDAALGEGRGACIVDAIAERHLLALGEAALRRPVSTGASGLGLGLARAIAGGAAPIAAAPRSTASNGTRPTGRADWRASTRTRLESRIGLSGWSLSGLSASGTAPTKRCPW